jgi:uracil-DNA glycosylase
MDRAGELAALHSRMRACRLCLEQGYEVTPGAVFSGPVSARVMVVGQAPGVTEAEAGRPFNAASGRRLFQWLGDVGWEEDVFRATEYLSAVTKCYPGRARGGKGDRVPTRAEQKLCAPFLKKELSLVAPQVILPVGGLAVRRFLGEVRLVDVVGTVVQVPKGRWIVPLPHPSGASLWLNRAANQARLAEALEHVEHLRHRLGP